MLRAKSHLLLIFERLMIIFGLIVLSDAFRDFIAAWNYVRIAVYALLLLFVLINSKDFITTLLRNPLILTLNIFALLSIMWSEAPAASISRNFALTMTTAFAIYFAARFTISEQLRLLAWTIAFLAVASVVVVIFAPERGLAGTFWMGVFGQKNVFGRLMTVGVLVALTIPVNTRISGILKIVATIILTLLVFLSNSVTSITLTLLLICLFFVYRMLRRGIVPLVAMAAATLVPFLVAMVLLGQIDTSVLLTDVGRDATLTGRTDVWSNVEYAISKHPWLGYGYNGFWNQWDGTYGTLWRQGEAWTPGNGHNSYLDLWLDLGVGGLVLFVLIATRYFFQAMRYARSTKTVGGLWPILFISFLLIESYAESLVLYNVIHWALFVTVCFSMSKDLASESAGERALERANREPLRAGLGRSLAQSKMRTTEAFDSEMGIVRSES